MIPNHIGLASGLSRRDPLRGRRATLFQNNGQWWAITGMPRVVVRFKYYERCSSNSQNMPPDSTRQTQDA
jgi:hypothetical protein